MNIKFIIPPSDFLIEQKVFPFLGVLYVAAYLEKNLIKSQVLDLSNETNLHESLRNIKADIFGITSTTPQFPKAVEVLNNLKINNPQALFVIGGAHASCMPEDCIRVGFDIAVKGEGEKAFLDIVNHKIKDSIVQYPYETNIDEFPLPSRELIDLKSYHFLMNNRETTTVLTSRGCPFDCKFCANSVWGKKVRFRSIENVINEINVLKTKWGYDSIMFFDDTFAINPTRTAALCNEIKKTKVIFRCFVRTDLIDYNTLKMLKDSGCVEIGMGMESGSQEILDKVSKKTTVEKGTQVVKWAHELGLRAKAFLMIGLPGETKKTVNDTIQWLKETRPDDYDIAIFIPYAGSDIYQNKQNYDIQFDFDYSKSFYKGRFGELKSMVSTSDLSAEEITMLRNQIYTTFKK